MFRRSALFACLANPFAGLQDTISRSYRLDQVIENAQPTDIILARQEKSSAFSFIRFANDCDTVDVASRLLLFPDNLRNFHALCGRDGVACDFYADVDLPNETRNNGEHVLLDMLNYLDVRLNAIGFSDPEYLILANHKPSPDKVSFHVHARSPSAAFQDYRVVRLLADEVNQAMGRDVIDQHCYRTHGMLRMAYSGKVGQADKKLVPLLQAKDTALQERLSTIETSLGKLSEAELLERSLCNRFPTSPTLGVNKHSNNKLKIIRAKTISGPQSATTMEFDAYGNPVSAYLTEAAKWRRFKSVIDKLRRLPPRTAETYDVWVRVGLALHNFSNEDHVFEEWVRFSLKCPQKYSREACRKKWVQFERNPDALNWRRGFNYLNSTIWRAVEH